MEKKIFIYMYMYVVFINGYFFFDGAIGGNMQILQ